MKDPGFPKFVVFFNSCVPLALLCWDAYRHQLGADPSNFALRTTGMLALIFLVLSLAVTPVRKITGYNFLSHFRRMLGLFAFFYGCTHLAIYFRFDRQLDLAGTIQDVIKRRFIFFGMASLLLMLPLAATSTNAMIKKLGGKNWKRLHTLAYPAAMAAALHYYMLVKADIRQPVAFGIVLGLLLLYRVLVNRVTWLRKSSHA